MKYLLALFFCFIISCDAYSQKIKSVTEYKSEKDTLIKVRETIFDKKGNLTRDVYFGAFDQRLKTYRNKKRLVSYEGANKQSEVNCEYFVRQDTCVVRSVSKYKTDDKNRAIEEIKYEPDSLIRYIRQRELLPDKRIETTYSWEFNPVEKVDKETALVLVDTVYFDSKGRDTLRVHYNSKFDNSWKEVIHYDETGYTVQRIGAAQNDTSRIKYDKLQVLAERKGINYLFKSGEEYSYEIKFYK